MSRRRKLCILLAFMFGLGLLAIPGSSQAATPKQPVIIVAGTTSPAFANEPLASRMRNDGYSVWIYVLPNLGLTDVHDSSAGLASLVDSVRTSTGAPKVSLVGHSQGGLVARDYVKTRGGSTKVDKIISLGAPHYGTAIANIAAFLGFGNCIGIVACQQMAIGSSYLSGLNAGDDSIGDVKYTNIASKLDEVVNPYTTSFLNSSDGNITNVAVQSKCWARVVGHVGLILDGTVYSGVRQALAGQSISLNCWAI